MTYIGETVIRTAAKPWECEGNGARPLGFARGCSGYIEKGSRYLEYYGETPAYQSGTRHCMKCADAFYREEPRQRQQCPICGAWLPDPPGDGSDNTCRQCGTEFPQPV